MPHNGLGLKPPTLYHPHKEDAGYVKRYNIPVIEGYATLIQLCTINQLDIEAIKAIASLVSSSRRPTATNRI